MPEWVDHAGPPILADQTGLIIEIRFRKLTVRRIPRISTGDTTGIRERVAEAAGRRAASSEPQVPGLRSWAQRRRVHRGQNRYGGTSGPRNRHTCREFRANVYVWTARGSTSHPR